MSEVDTRFLEVADGTAIAYEHSPGVSPAVVFLGGYMSDMTGTKGTYLAEWCSRRARQFLRLDYSGHGQSGGEFADGTIGRWRDDALAVIRHCIDTPCVLVGSSMGGWIMLLVARALGARVHGLVGIAAAPDFTRDLMWEGFDEATRRRLESEGIVHITSGYDDWEIPVRREFIEDGLRHIQLDAPIPVRCPVRLLHGRQDPDVPWQTSERLMARLESDDVIVSYFKNGDHRMSEPAQLDFLGSTLARLLGEE